MRSAIIMLSVLAFGFTATAANAARRPAVRAVAAKVAPRFQALDINSSGSLDAGEWAATSAPASSFGLVDLNDNGSIGMFELVRVTIARAVTRRRG
jgi:hypothetical protein